MKSKGHKRQKEVKSRREESRRKKEETRARNVRKVAAHCAFPMICGSGSGGCASRLAKAAGAEPPGQMRHEKHSAVARSKFGSQHVKNMRGSEHFWKFECWKSAGGCGARHISKSKCAKHTRFGPLLEVGMSEQCTPLWRETRFQVPKIIKYI